MEILKNGEKAMTVDALKGKYSLPLLLKRLKLSKSSYYYQGTSPKKQDKYSGIRKRTSALFNENNGRYGHRRIHALLSREGIVIPERVVRRIIAEEEIVVRAKSRRNYNPSQGQISLSVPNAGNRDFHARKSNEKWLIDIT